MRRLDNDALVLDVGIGTASALCANRWSQLPRAVFRSLGFEAHCAFIARSDLVQRKRLRVIGIDYDASYINKVGRERHEIASREWGVCPPQAQVVVRAAGLQDRVTVRCVSVYDFDEAGPFDAIYFSGSLMIMPDPVKALTHVAKRVSDPTGAILWLSLRPRVSRSSARAVSCTPLRRSSWPPRLCSRSSSRS